MCEFDGQPLNLAGDPDWMRAAACVATDPDVFTGTSSVEDAKAICRRCPVQPNCLEYAIAADERVGVWGGMTRHEREAVRLRRLVSQ